MKIGAIIAGVLALLLLVGAAVRVATMEYDTKPLVDVGLMPDRDFDEYAMIRAEQEPEGNSRTEVSEEPARPSGGGGRMSRINEVTTTDEFEQGVEIQESREDDLNDAKEKIGKRF